MESRMSRITTNDNFLPDSRDVSIPNPSIRDYFIEYGNAIRNRGYVDKVKLKENMRIVTLNIKGCQMKSNQRIREIRESIEKHQIDVALFSESNTKWNTRNCDKVEKEIKQLGKGTMSIAVDSK